MKNNKNRRYSIKSRLRCFRYAARGILILFRKTPNALIHLIAALLAVNLGVLLRISSTEWLFIILAIGIVFAAEVFNTAIEMMVDKLSPDYDERAGQIKDLAAAAVLITAISAAAIGGIIFIPRLLAMAR